MKEKGGKGGGGLANLHANLALTVADPFLGKGRSLGEKGGDMAQGQQVSHPRNRRRGAHSGGGGSENINDGFHSKKEKPRRPHT